MHKSPSARMFDLTIVSTTRRGIERVSTERDSKSLTGAATDTILKVNCFLGTFRKRIGPKVSMKSQNGKFSSNKYLQPSKHFKSIFD